MNSMKIDKDTLDKIERLPLILRMAAKFLLNCLEKIVNDECDETEVINALNAVKDNSEGRYSTAELMNYDEAGNALGFGVTNRVGLKRFLDKHNVKQVKFGSTKVGFPRSKIIALQNKKKK